MSRTTEATEGNLSSPDGGLLYDSKRRVPKDSIPRTWLAGDSVVTGLDETGEPHARKVSSRSADQVGDVMLESINGAGCGNDQHMFLMCCRGLSRKSSSGTAESASLLRGCVEGKYLWGMEVSPLQRLQGGG